MKQQSLTGALLGLLSFFLLLVSVGNGLVQHGVNAREAARLQRTMQDLTRNVARLETQHRLDVEYVRNADHRRAIAEEYQRRYEDRLRTIHADCDAREAQVYRECSLWGGHIVRRRTR